MPTYVSRTIFNRRGEAIKVARDETDDVVRITTSVRADRTQEFEGIQTNDMHLGRDEAIAVVLCVCDAFGVPCELLMKARENVG